MLSQPKNRVQAIKSKFENLSSETPNQPPKSALNKTNKTKNDTERKEIQENKENSCKNRNTTNTDVAADETTLNRSYLYKNDVKRSASDSKASLTRQISDPGKKLQRSHAFRCERTQLSPKRNAFCNRSINMDRKLSKDRLKKLGDFLEEHMKKDNFIPPDLITEAREVSPVDSIPDSQVPPHILAQYAKVIKPKKDQDPMTDSGVSSETENLEDDRSRVKKLTYQFEQEKTIIDQEKSVNGPEKSTLVPEKSSNGPVKFIHGLERSHGVDKLLYRQDKSSILPEKSSIVPDKSCIVPESVPNISSYEKISDFAEGIPENTGKKYFGNKKWPVKSNLISMEELAGSSETMKLERKNPHLKLTDTLKKALKQPLPSGPPPRKPPRNPPNELEKSDTKRKLEKLEQLLMKQDFDKKGTVDTISHNKQTMDKRETMDKNIYDIAEENLSLKQPKEVHYLCTEILDIKQRTLPNDNSPTTTNSPLKNCFGRLNCTKTTSMSSLPYNRLSASLESNRNSCTCSDDNLNVNLLDEKCQKCQEKGVFLDENCPNCQSDRENCVLLDEKCQNCQLNQENGFTCHLNMNLFDGKCRNCQVNEEKGFKCHLKCDCREKNSEFFVDTHIYDEPFVDSDRRNKYGTLNSVKLNGVCSKSLEDLRRIGKEETSIYEIPCDVTPPPCSQPKPPQTQKTDFQKLLENFENSSLKAKSTESLDAKYLKRSDRSVERSVAKYATEVKRYRKEDTKRNLENERNSISLQLSRLMDEMSEVYATAASNMDDNKPGSFPTDPSDGTSEESVKLNRSLTEKRKNYVRRVSSRLAYLEPAHIKNTRYRHQTSTCSYKSYKTDQENPYTTFRSWKSFRESQFLSKMDLNSSSKTNKTFSNKTGDINDKTGHINDKTGHINDKTGHINDKTGHINDKIGHNDKTDHFNDKTDGLNGETDSLTDSLDHKTGCVDIECPFERENGLFNVCLLVGLNYMTGQAYVKSIFPSQVKIPQHIENLIFPETFSQEKGDWTTDAKSTQCYSFVLTDERGERSYGYCRRVLPEGATTCLPLCYCLIGKYRAPGFYYKVLQEIESHHGSSNMETNVVLQKLFDSDFPNPGESITITYINSANVPQNLANVPQNLANVPQNLANVPQNLANVPLNLANVPLNLANLPQNLKNLPQNESSLLQNHTSLPQNVDLPQNLFQNGNLGPNQALSEEMKCKTMPDLRGRDFDNYCDNNNISKGMKVKTILRPLEPRSEETSMCELLDACGAGVLVKMFATLLHERKLVVCAQTLRVKTIVRPLEPRSEETSMCELLDACGAGVLVKMFATLLHERKLVVCAQTLSSLSHSMCGLQSIIYPFVWQQPLISCAPHALHKEVAHAPLPILSGLLATQSSNMQLPVEEGMFIDLGHPSKILSYQGDETTILPTNCYKTLKTSLQMETLKNAKDDSKTRNVMISEAFLRFFVDILGDFWRFFSLGERQEGDMGKGEVVFDKDNFIKSATSKQNQYFLEWFTETAMFNHFIQNMSCQYYHNILKYPQTSEYKLIDAPTPNFYQLFEERLQAKLNRTVVDKSGYKIALNKVKLLKARLKELVG